LIRQYENTGFTIKREAAKLSDIGQDLASSMNETAAAVNEITANVKTLQEASEVRRTGLQKEWQNLFTSFKL
jgi:methyl-accepting chemotaxis protein